MPKLSRNHLRFTALALLLALTSISCSGTDEPMTESEFWEIIDNAHAATGFNAEEKQARIERKLSSMSRPRAVSFFEWFEHQEDRAYRDDVWDAMFILLGGCSDDGFMDARAALIGLGHERFTAILDDPDSLIEYANPEAIWYFSHENLGYAFFNVLGELPDASEKTLELPFLKGDLTPPAGYARESSLPRLLEWEAAGSPVTDRAK